MKASILHITKVVRFLLMTFLLTALALSCKQEVEEPDPVLEVFVSSLSFGPDGGTEELSFTANYPWKAYSAQDWCQLSQTNGQGSETTQTLSVTCSSNDSYDVRSVRILLEIQGGGVKAVEVTQVKNEGLFVSPSSFDLDGKGQTITIKVSANVPYKVEIDEGCKSWIHEVPKGKALEERNILLDIDPNEDYETAREGKVTVTTTEASGVLKTEVPVRQDAMKGYLIENRSVEVSREAQSIEIPLRSNVAYKVTVDDKAADWLTLSSQVDVKGPVPPPAPFTLSVKENTMRQAREANVFISVENGAGAARTDTLEVTQYGLGYTIVLGLESGDLHIPKIYGSSIKAGLLWEDGKEEEYTGTLVRKIPQGGPSSLTLKIGGNPSWIRVPSLSGVTSIDLTEF